MTTVINTPASSNDNSGMGFFIGIVILIIVGLMFFYYGLPAIRNMGTPQVNIPSKIDVNVNQPK